MYNVQYHNIYNFICCDVCDVVMMWFSDFKNDLSTARAEKHNHSAEKAQSRLFPVSFDVLNVFVRVTDWLTHRYFSNITDTKKCNRQLLFLKFRSFKSFFPNIADTKSFHRNLCVRCYTLLANAHLSQCPCVLKNYRRYLNPKKNWPIYH